MKAQKQSLKLDATATHAMYLAWLDYHCGLADDEVPQISQDFNRAWKIQQNIIENQQRKIRCMHFAMTSSIEVLKRGTEQEMRETANFLTAIQRITE